MMRNACARSLFKVDKKEKHKWQWVEMSKLRCFYSSIRSDNKNARELENLITVPRLIDTTFS